MPSRSESVEITDEMVLRAARMLRFLGWDNECDDDLTSDLKSEPTSNLENAVRVALRAAIEGIPGNEYVMEGPK